MKVWLIVWKKELLDALRDQRTVFFMIVFPLVMYPLLMVGIGRMARSQEKEIEATTVVVAVQNAEAAPQLIEQLGRAKNVKVVSSRDAAADVRTKAAEAGIVVPADLPARLISGAKVEIQLLADDSREIDREARSRAEDAIHKFAQVAASTALKAHGLPGDLADPIDIQKQDLTPPDKKGGSLLAMFLPYFLALAVANGVVSTAIDTTAGEKDRSTLETILVSSADRTGILVGKLLAVVSAALVATVASAAGLAITLLMGGMVSAQSDKGAALQVSFGALAGVILLAIPVAVLISAILISMGCFAKSAREGQMMAVSLQMAVIFGGLGSMFQQAEPQMRQFAIPVLGTALVQKEILRGELNPTHLMVAVVSSVVLAAIAIVMSARLFGNERLMFRAK